MKKLKPLFYLAPAAIKKLALGRNYSACIEITDKCNLRCRHCYHRIELKEQDKTTLDQWRGCFGKLKQQGIKMAVLTGGEPTMRMDVVKLAGKYFPFVITFTNGYKHIEPDFRHRIYFSLNQLPALIKDGYERELSQTAAARYTDDKRVVVCACLTQDNYQGSEGLKELIDFVRRMNVAGMHIEFHLPFKGEGSELALSKEDKEEIEKVLLAELARQDSVLLATPGLIKAQTNDSFPSFPGKCPMRDNNVLIDAGGRPKNKIAEQGDCERCSYRGKYVVPFRYFREWLAFKKVIYKSMFDV